MLANVRWSDLCKAIHNGLPNLKKCCGRANSAKVCSKFVVEKSTNATLVNEGNNKMN
ncbi:hypothetical protein G9A89_005533 [Geosiphon pyriformis]|nr:hypothetical protein G9A89_005533 [Geosiphon pyriformis]